MMTKPPANTAMQLFLMDAKMPGTNVKAPMIMWGFLAFCILGGLGAAVWIHSYNREET